MLRAMLGAVAALAAVLLPAAAVAADGSYTITDYYAGTSINGTGTGAHTLPAGHGTYGQTKVTGGASPVVISLGQIGAGDETYLRMDATYSYTMTIVADDPTAMAKLQALIVSHPLPMVIGHISGLFNMSGTDNSDSSVKIVATSEFGSTSFYDSCDGGSCYGPGGTIPSGTDTPWSLTLYLDDFGFGCTSTCEVLPGSNPFSKITMEAAAGVGFTTDSTGRSIGGSVSSMIDPTPSLDPGFFLSHGLNPSDFSLQVSTVAVPEPATWALMIAGMGLAGGLLRRRRTGVVAKAL
jgi:hypothetical protein